MMTEQQYDNIVKLTTDDLRNTLTEAIGEEHQCIVATIVVTDAFSSEPCEISVNVCSNIQDKILIEILELVIEQKKKKLAESE